jgi:hypothetical protein
MIFQPSSASSKLQQYKRTEDVSHCIFVGLFWNLDYKRLQEQQPKNTGAKCPKFKAETNNICVALEQHQHLNIMQSLCDLIFNQQMQIPVFA